MSKGEDKQQTDVDEVERIFALLDKRIVNGIAMSIAMDKDFDTDNMLADAKTAVRNLLDEREREAYKRGYIAAGVDGLTAERGEVGK